MVPRKRIDISAADLVAGAAYCFRSHDETQLHNRLNSAWPGEKQACPFLSVRSGFDATLHALNFEEGNEILVTALTIRDMEKIISKHGLIAVPIDINPDRLDIDLASLKAAISAKTKAILVAHLFGSRMCMERIIEFAEEHGLLVFEDCAQAFIGREFQGDPRSDVRMFSFGPIKTATALGGAVFRFRDDGLREKVYQIESEWPRQSRFRFLKRVMKYGFFLFVGNKMVYGLFVAICKLMGTDQEAVLAKGVRGFAGEDFFSLIRQRPSLPLLALLARRVEKFNSVRIDERRRFAEKVMASLQSESIVGKNAKNHTYWIFPIFSQKPDELVRFLRSNGFDATRGQTSMAVIGFPSDESRKPIHIIKAFSQLVYLPVYPQVSDADIELLLESISEFG